MAKNRKPTKNQEKHISVGEVVEKTEIFVTKYQKPIIIGISVIVLLVLVFFGYKKLYSEPRNDEALARMYLAEQQFRIDSFRLAFEGEPGSYYGFRRIIEDFGSTDAGNLARYYAGICQLRLGNFDEAVKHLKKYSSEDELIQAKAYAAIGDAYVELNSYNEAAGYFMKAADFRDNVYAAGYLLKAAMVYEELNRYADAIKAYERIRENYPNTMEAQQAEKEIVRVNILSQRN
ncbi:MAG: tetratricopeptide repeat protein [Prevotellaceae bacterium]|jgi:tetratricopeptide (TPR) repeat protein|nr:tetratricopeptide repeat protein [Prevotellaceae bacterium]